MATINATFTNEQLATTKCNATELLQFEGADKAHLLALFNLIKTGKMLITDYNGIKYDAYYTSGNDRYVDVIDEDAGLICRIEAAPGGKYTIHDNVHQEVKENLSWSKEAKGLLAKIKQDYLINMEAAVDAANGNSDADDSIAPENADTSFEVPTEDKVA